MAGCESYSVLGIKPAASRRFAAPHRRPARWLGQRPCCARSPEARRGGRPELGGRCAAGHSAAVGARGRPRARVSAVCCRRAAPGRPRRGLRANVPPVHGHGRPARGAAQCARRGHPPQGSPPAGQQASAPCASLGMCECQPAATSCAQAQPLGPRCASIRVRVRVPSTPTAATWAVCAGVHGGAHCAGRRELAQLLGAPSWAHYQVSVELLVAADRVAPLQHAPCSCELQRLAALLHARRIRAHQHA